MFGLSLIRSGRVEILESKINELQGTLIDFASGIEVGALVTTGNAFTFLREAVQAIRRKYLNEDDFGSPFIQRIIDVRKAMVLPHGVDIQISDATDASQTEVDAAEAVVKKFIDFNDLNEGTGIDLAREGELEGNVLIDLRLWDEEMKTVKMVYRSWLDTQYTIIRETIDPGRIAGVMWEEVTDTQKRNIPGGRIIVSEGTEGSQLIANQEMVFIAFHTVKNGFLGVPTVASILTLSENLHKTLTNWHRYNSLFGKVTPVFEVETEEEAELINKRIVEGGWKLGNAIAMHGKLTYAGPSDSAVADSLKDEIITDLEVMAGHTGVGPHFLGFPQVMSNRATAESMGEPTEIVALSEIALWRNFYEDMFDKIIAIHNIRMAQKVKPGIIKPKLMPMTDRQWDRAVKFWLPSMEKGLISQELFLENIPGVDVQEELERQDKEQSEKLLNQDEMFGNLPEEDLEEEEELPPDQE